MPGATQQDIIDTFTHLDKRIVQSHNIIIDKIGTPGMTSLGERIKTWGEAHEKSLSVIDKTSNKIKSNTNDVQRFAAASLFAASVTGTGESIFRMVKAFSNERQTEGAAEILRMTGSLAQLSFLLGGVKQLGKFGAIAGPVGAMVSELMNMIAGFMIEGIGPEQQSVGEQLKEELAEFGGSQNLDRLEGVLDALERVRADLGAREQGSLSWDEVNRIGRFTGGGGEVVWLGAAESWLRRETKTEVWSTVFEAYLYVVSQFMQNIVMGLRALKGADNGGEPTASLIAASAVMTRIIYQYDDFVAKMAPIARRQGERWFIGSNEGIYFTDHKGDRRIGARDTKAKQICIVSDGERLFQLGTSESMYTMMKDQWEHFSWPGIRGIAAAQIPETSRSYLVTRTANFLRYNIWDESRSGNRWQKNLELSSHDFYHDNKDGEIVAHAVTGDGTVYFLDSKDRLGRIEAVDRNNNASEYKTITAPTLEGEEHLRGLSTNRDSLYLYSAGRLWSKPHDEVEQGSAWTSIPGPMDKPVYDHVFASEDGAILAIVNQKIYVYNGDDWMKVDDNTARQVVKLPVRGWEMFLSLKSLANDLKDATRKLKLWEKSPPFAEIMVEDEAFKPGEITISVGGKVKWTWAVTQPSSVTGERFDSGMKASGTFEVTFDKAGTFAYHSKRSPDTMKGVINVVTK